MTVRARPFGWRDAQADPTDPAVPTFEGRDWVTGDAPVTDEVDVPEQGIHYRRVLLNGVEVDPDTLEEVGGGGAPGAPG